jgi:hypothetical protein
MTEPVLTTDPQLLELSQPVIIKKKKIKMRVAEVYPAWF